MFVIRGQSHVEPQIKPKEGVLRCHIHKGSGELEKYITLREFQGLLDKPMQWNPITVNSLRKNPSARIRTNEKVLVSKSTLFT